MTSSLFARSFDRPIHPQSWKPRSRVLQVRAADRAQMATAADIIRSTADWYRSFLAPKDMAQHDVGPEWEAENFRRRDFFLGWSEERPVGVLATQSAGDCLYLGYVYLYESEVGRGYGRQLLEFARERALRLDKRALVLIAHPKAKWAVRAYQNFGFDKIASQRSDVLSWENGWLQPYYEEGFELYAHELEDSVQCAAPSKLEITASRQ